MINLLIFSLFFLKKKIRHKSHTFVYNILFINIHYAINAVAFEHQIHLQYFGSGEYYNKYRRDIKVPPLKLSCEEDRLNI